MRPLYPPLCPFLHAADTLKIGLASWAALGILLQVPGQEVPHTNTHTLPWAAAAAPASVGLVLGPIPRASSPSHCPLLPGPPSTQLYYPATVTPWAAIVSLLSNALALALPASQLVTTGEDRDRVWRDFTVRGCTAVLPLHGLSCGNANDWLGDCQPIPTAAVAQQPRKTGTAVVWRSFRACGWVGVVAL